MRKIRERQAQPRTPGRRADGLTG
ncbi:hypothetical protein [Streptomyces sp. NBC_01725]